jgi:methylthioribulose-1-phosphate dehydratase
MNAPSPLLPADAALAAEMIAAGQLFHARGWVPATGGNFSARRDAASVLITASGGHKGELRPDQFLVCDLDGRLADPARKASYETGLHLQVYRRWPTTGAVLHTHSPANTVLSRRFERILLQGYELQKVLPGQPDPATAVKLPVFENDQDIARLAAKVDTHLAQRPETPAYLIAGHGLYAWGASIAAARHAVEALEFMLDCQLRELSL